jgi:hypothetical protein
MNLQNSKFCEGGHPVERPLSLSATGHCLTRMPYPASRDFTCAISPEQDHRSKITSLKSQFLNLGFVISAAKISRQENANGERQ